MDGNKKVKKGISLFLAFLFLAACSVKKPVGISFFESASDSLYTRYGIDSSYIVRAEADSFGRSLDAIDSLYEQSFTEPSPAYSFSDSSAKSIENPAYSRLASIDTILPANETDLQSYPDGIDFVSSDTLPVERYVSQRDMQGNRMSSESPAIEASESDSSLANIKILLDSLLRTQKLILIRAEENHQVLLEKQKQALSREKIQDTIIIKNEIVLSGNAASSPSPPDRSPVIIQKDSYRYSDTIAYLLSEVKRLNKIIAANADSENLQAKAAKIEKTNVPVPDKSSWSAPVRDLLDAKDDSIQILQVKIRSLEKQLKGSSQSSAARLEPASGRELQALSPKIIQDSGGIPPESKKELIDSIAKTRFGQEEEAEQDISKGSGRIPNFLPATGIQNIEPRKQITLRDSSDIGKTNTYRDGERSSIAAIYGERDFSGYSLLLEDSITQLRRKLDSLERIFEGDAAKSMLMLRDSLLFAYYETGSLEASNEQEIMPVIRSLIARKNIESVFISGFADKSGSPEFNLVLTRKRVDLIGIKLVDAGIDAQRIFSQYFGSEFASPAVDSRDRRVEIVLKFY